MRIILVEDDEGLAQTRSHFISEGIRGVTLEVIGTERQLVDEIQRWADGGNPMPDALVLDGRLLWSHEQPVLPGNPQLEAGRRAIIAVRSHPALADLPIVAYSVDNRAFGGLVLDGRTQLIDKDDVPAGLVDALRSLLTATGRVIPHRRRVARRAEKIMLRVAAVIGAVAVVGTPLGWIGDAWHWATGGHSRSYVYLTTAPVVAEQYALPMDGSVAQSAGLLAYGSQVDVVCAVDSGGQRWVRLTSGTWLRGKDVIPAANEVVGLASVPRCASP